MEKICYKLTLASLFVLAASIFTSVSISAISHILILVPGIYFLLRFVKEKPFKLPASFYLLLSLCFVIIISVITNTDTITSPLKNIIKIKYFLLALFSVPAYFYTFKNYLTHKMVKTLLWTFAIATSVATISGLIALYTGFNPIKFKAACHLERACGLYGMYMTYGYGISLFMVLVTGAIIYKERFESFISVKYLYIIWFINFLGLYFSLARGAWIGYLAAIPFFFLKKNKKSFLTVALIGVVAVGASLTSTNVRKMFFDRARSNDERISFWKAAVAAANEKPFFGYGYRNFEPNVSKIKTRYDLPFASVNGHAHNNLLEHLASTGYVGLLVLIAFLATWLLATYNSAQILFPFVISFTVSGMVQYTFGDGENLFLILLIWALSIVIPQVPGTAGKKNKGQI